MALSNQGPDLGGPFRTVCHATSKTRTGSRSIRTTLRNGTLKTDPDDSHGKLTVNAEVMNADLLAFIKT